MNNSAVIKNVKAESFALSIFLFGDYNIIMLVIHRNLTVYYRSF